MVHANVERTKTSGVVQPYAGRTAPPVRPQCSITMGRIHSVPGIRTSGLCRHGTKRCRSPPDPPTFLCSPQQCGHGMVLLDLHALAGGDIQLHYVTAAMLPRLGVRENLFAEVKAAIVDYDPVREFLVLAWLPASMFFYRLKRVDAETV